MQIRWCWSSVDPLSRGEGRQALDHARSRRSELSATCRRRRCSRHDLMASGWLASIIFPDPLHGWHCPPRLGP